LGSEHATGPRSMQSARRTPHRIHHRSIYGTPERSEGSVAPPNDDGRRNQTRASPQIQAGRRIAFAISRRFAKRTGASFSCRLERLLETLRNGIGALVAHCTLQSYVRLVSFVLRTSNAVFRLVFLALFSVLALACSPAGVLGDESA